MQTSVCCCQTQSGVSPVYATSQEGHTEVVDLLVQAGADIHLATNKVHVGTHTLSSSVATVVETNRDEVEHNHMCSCKSPINISGMLGMQLLDANLSRRLWPSFIVQELKGGLEILQKVVEGIEKVHYT